MASSSVPATKAALLVKLQAALSGVQVTYFHAGANIAKESVFMGPARFADEESSIGQVSHYENYTVPVWVTVLHEGDAAQTAEERVWTLVASIESAVRTDGTLGGVANLLYAYVTNKEPGLYVAPEGYVAECMVSVECKAKI